MTFPHGDMCDCGHPWPPHILVAYDNPLDGGLIFCQELTTCGCIHTWDVPQAGQLNRVLPPQHVIDEYRQALIEQTGGNHG